MNQQIKLLSLAVCASALLVLPSTQPVWAFTENVSVPVTVSISQAAAVVVAGTITFGAISKSGTTAGKAAMDGSGGITYTGSFTGLSTGTNATLQLRNGQANMAVTTVLNGTPELVDGANKIILKYTQGNNQEAKSTDASGLADVKVGTELTLSGSQLPGSYTGNLTLTVTF